MYSPALRLSRGSLRGVPAEHAGNGVCDPPHEPRSGRDVCLDVLGELWRLERRGCAVNCKPGDMAIVIRGPRENLGLSVTVLRLHKHPVFAGRVLVQCGGGPFWEIDRPLSYPAMEGPPVHVPFSADEALMPIRPERDDEFLEMLRESYGRLNAPHRSVTI